MPERNWNESFDSIVDVKKLTAEELEGLAQALRERIIRQVAATGGHLASNLGVVELTIALLRVFDFPQDQIVFDVGHQCYAWKLLTGRGRGFSQLRRRHGLSGFPKRQESPYDVFETGHSSTSISAALGLLRAARAQGSRRQVVALIGDGALSGGMSFEALNDAGQHGDDLLVIVNDNQMSIDRAVGGLARHLERIRLSRRYWRLKTRWEARLEQAGGLGRRLARLLNRTKSSLRTLIRPRPVLFEQLGFRYYGPVDGHDLIELEQRLQAVRSIPGPVVLHVLTQKGRGYHFAESAPATFHGVAPFVVENGVSLRYGRQGPTFSEVLGETLCKLAADQPNLVAISAAMTQGTGLASFGERYPERFYDVGIAEQHAVTLAAGLAAGGLKPFVALYSTFLQRACDQLIHDVCLQNLPVVVTIDRAGAVGEDGSTHQGYYDLAIAQSLPNVVLFTPARAADLEAALHYAANADQPVLIRYPRATAPAGPPRELFRLHKVRPGGRTALLVLGALEEEALAAAERAAEQGVDCTVILALCTKPYDFDGMIRLNGQIDRLLIVEDGVERGGVGEHLALEAGRRGLQAAIEVRGHRDLVSGQATRRELLEASGLDRCGLAAWICQKD